MDEQPDGRIRVGTVEREAAMNALGRIGMAIAQLFLSLMWVGVIWCIVDGVLILAQGGTDRQGLQLRN